MTPEKKAEYRKLAEEVMEPVLTVAARRLGQAVEEMHTSQIKPLRDEIEKLRAMWQPAPRGGMTSDWQYWSLVYQRRLRKLKKLIAAQGYDIVSDEDGMPTALERNKP